MSKKPNYTPIITLKELGANKLQVNCHVKEYPELGLSTFKINGNFSALNLSFEGLDCLNHVQEQDFISGKVFLNIDYQKSAEPTKELLSDINLKVNINKKLTPTANLKNTRSQIMTAWQEALDFAFDSLSGIEPVHSTPKFNNAQTPITKKIFPRTPAIAAAVILFLLTISYGGLAVYDRYQNIVMAKNQNKLLDVTIDPEKISASEDALISKTLSEAGIDRSQLKNDMSCFSELPN